ncbi:hypothetical protein [Staphylococcus hominis]|uniref:hypothetical protein n=1 Tax=Staphylococcus hominis TaxID=1290 RepID=UPI000915DE2C|nr:hypothetical protein [Staphylococcus hominis]SFX83987.1 hypothetical protein SAMN04487789_1422 [Staphylococcus hominis]
MKKKLIPYIFIGSPILFGVVMSTFFKNIFDLKWIMNFVTSSGWFLSFFSVLLIFMTFDKVSESVILKNIGTKRYLEGDGTNQLIRALEDLLSVMDDKEDISYLKESCRDIKFIHNTLKSQKQDTLLSSLDEEIRDVFSDINKLKLESIGKNNDIGKWKKIEEKEKESLIEKVYYLKKQLSYLFSD